MASGYSVSIGLVDNITKPLANINKHLASSQAPFKRLQSQIDKFKDLSGINKISDGFKSMIGFVESALSSVLKMIPALGALVGAGTIAGMFKLVQAWGELGTKLLNVGAVVGSTATQLQTMQNAARLGGASADDMASSLEGLGKAAQDALSGKNSGAAALFQQYGVNIRKSAYQAKSGAELMGAAFDIIKKLKDNGASAAVIQQAMSTLGLSSGMTRFAEEGAAGLAKYNKMAEHFGVMSPRAAEEADKLRFSFSKLQLAIEGFGNAIAEKVGPVLGPLIDQLSEWIAANREFIATKIGEYIKQFGEWLASIDFKQVIHDVKEWAEHINDIVQSFGGWQAVSEALIGLWIGSKAIAMLATIGKLASILTNPVVAAFVGGVAAGAAIDHGMTKEAQAMKHAQQNGFEVDGVDEYTGKPTGYSKDGKHYTVDELSKLQEESDTAAQPTTYKSGSAEKTSAKEAYDFYIGKGLSPSAAAGMAAQEQAESGFNPRAVGDKGLAHGLYQWHPERRAAILKGAGIDIDKADATQQREAAWWELNNTHKGALAALRAAKNAGTAGMAGSINFEGPADRNGEAIKRAGIATGIANTFSNGTDASRSLATTKAPPAPPPLPPVGQQSMGPQQGTLQVSINAPAGWPTTARASGNVLDGAPRVNSPMSSYAMG